MPVLLAAPTFPWAAGGPWGPLLRPEVLPRIRLAEYAAGRYSQALAEVPRLAGESPEDRRIREVLCPGLRPRPPATRHDGHSAEFMAPAAFLLDVNRWLSQSGVTIR